MNLDNLENIPNSELKLFLKNHNVNNYSKLKRKDLIKKVKAVLKHIQKGGVEPIVYSDTVLVSSQDLHSGSLAPAQDENATNKSSTRNMFRCCIS